MQKRVGLARAIAARPDILFFDEPTTGLDPIMGAVIDGLIVDCVKRLGSTAVAITHDMASAVRIGDRAAMLHRGRIAWEGPASDLLHSGSAVVDQFTMAARGADPDGAAQIAAGWLARWVAGPAPVPLAGLLRAVGLGAKRGWCR